MSRAAFFLALGAFAPCLGLGTLELDTWISDPGGHREPATLLLAFPDSLGGVDARILLGPARGDVLLPSGNLSRIEADFLAGLRAFAAGDAGKAMSAWAGLRGRRINALLQSCLNVNAGLVLSLRGETAEAEAHWMREWKTKAPAAEGAWRNLLGLYLAQRRFAEAGKLLERVLGENPRHRVAAIAKLSWLRQLRPDAEVEAFLKSGSGPGGLPEIQAAYGEFLAEKGRWAEARSALDAALAALPRHGRGWRLLAEAQYRQGLHFFALECLENAFRSGYRESDLYELFARVLRGCCMAVEDERSRNARRTAEKLLEEGLPKDLHRRSMAHLLYHVYCQNEKPEAARRLERDLWFHFQDPAPIASPLAAGKWRHAGLDSRRLRTPIGMHSLSWLLTLRDRDFYRAF